MLESKKSIVLNEITFQLLWVERKVRVCEFAKRKRRNHSVNEIYISQDRSLKNVTCQII